MSWTWADFLFLVANEEADVLFNHLVAVLS